MKRLRMLLLLAACAAPALHAAAYDDAMKAVAAHNDAAALPLFESALNADPDNLMASNEYRKAVIRAKEYDRAIDFYDKLTAAHPQAAFAWLNYGYTYVDKIPDAGSITQVILANSALTNFSKSIEIKKSWIALYTRGNSYLYWPKIFGRAPLGVADLEAAVAIARAEPKKRKVYVRSLDRPRRRLLEDRAAGEGQGDLEGGAAALPRRRPAPGPPRPRRRRAREVHLRSARSQQARRHQPVVAVGGWSEACRPRSSLAPRSPARRLAAQHAKPAPPIRFEEIGGEGGRPADAPHAGLPGQERGRARHVHLRRRRRGGGGLRRRRRRRPVRHRLGRRQAQPPAAQRTPARPASSPSPT